MFFVKSITRSTHKKSIRNKKIIKTKKITAQYKENANDLRIKTVEQFKKKVLKSKARKSSKRGKILYLYQKEKSQYSKHYKAKRMSITKIYFYQLLKI